MIIQVQAQISSTTVAAAADFLIFHLSDSIHNHQRVSRMMEHLILNMMLYFLPV
jgi:hypothetical protein